MIIHICLLNRLNKLNEMSKYLKSLACYGGSKVHENSNVLEMPAINAIAKIVKEHESVSKIFILNTARNLY